MPKCARGTSTQTLTAAQWQTKRWGLGGWGNWSQWQNIPGVNAALPMALGPFNFDSCTCPPGQRAVVRNCVPVPAFDIAAPWTVVPVVGRLPGLQVRLRVQFTTTINQQICDLACVAAGGQQGGGGEYFFLITDEPDKAPSKTQIQEFRDSEVAQEIVSVFLERCEDDEGPDSETPDTPALPEK